MPTVQIDPRTGERIQIDPATGERVTSPTTVTMFAPNGSTGEIPQNHVQDALNGGFKRAYEMTSPDGKSTGYIPEDRLTDAQKAGFKLTSIGYDALAAQHGGSAVTPVTLDFSKAQPISGAPQGGVALDFSKAVPISSNGKPIRSAGQQGQYTAADIASAPRQQMGAYSLSDVAQPSPTYLDSNGNPIPAGGKTYLDENGNALPAGPSLDLTNRLRQGTYPMAGNGQTVAVPYGQVQRAAQLGYSFADDTTRFRYAKDNAADPNRTTNYAPTPGYVAPDESSLPVGMQAVGGIAKGAATLAKPLTDLLGAGIGMTPQDINDQLTAHGAIQTGAKAATIGAAAIPAAIAAPVATAGALVGGAAGAGAGQVIGNLANLSPTQTQLLSDALGVAGGAGGAYGTNRGWGALANFRRPTPDPSIVPRNEFAARQLSAAILPANKDAMNFIQAAKQEVPNILEYAKRTNNPLNTQLEFSKAAQGYAQEVRGLYEDKILGPVSGNLVRTTGTGFGSRMGEGQDTYATLGEIDKRISAINTQLDAPALNADDARRALASKTGLQNEAAGLRNILHQNLSQSSGLAPEQIADIRQRVGRSYELANDTNAAVTQRMQSAGKAGQMPLSRSQILGSAAQFVRGGPVAIADRAFQTAISRFPGQAQPLPAVSAPAPAAAPSTLDNLLQSAKEQRLSNLLSLQNLLK